MIGFCVEFLHRTNTQTSVGVTQALTPSAAFSFQILFALQREFRRLHSADGSKLFRLYTSPSARDSSRHVWRSELSAGDRVSAQFLTRVSVSISPYANCRDFLSRNLLHVSLKSKLNNDFMQNLHLNRASATTKTRLSAFLIIHSVARVAPVYLAFVAVA